jgi:hypothetical protein
MTGGARPVAPRVWVLLSHNTGDNTQLLALAHAIGFPFEVKRLAYRPIEWLPRILLGATLLSVDRDRSSSLEPPAPDLIIGAGRRTEAVAFWIRRHLNPLVKLVYLGMPWAGLDRFDLVITTPQYRLPALPNVLHNTLPLHGISPERLAEAAREWQSAFSHLPKPRIAVLAGGRTGPYLFGPAAAARLAREACTRARGLGGSLLVTTSARTAPAAAQALFDNLDVPAYCHRWQSEQSSNPYLAYLALADEMIVTADSVSMIAEACATGKPTWLFDIEGGQRSMRAEEAAHRSGVRLPPPYWRGGDLASTLWRLGLIFGPDWSTRDIRIVHRELVNSGRVAWLGEPMPRNMNSEPRQDLERAVDRILKLIRAGIGPPNGLERRRSPAGSP